MANGAIFVGCAGLTLPGGNCDTSKECEHSKCLRTASRVVLVMDDGFLWSQIVRLGSDDQANIGPQMSSRKLGLTTDSVECRICTERKDCG